MEPINVPRCPICKGTGKVPELPFSTKDIYALAIACPNEPVAIREKLCLACKGTGIAHEAL